MEEGVPSPAIEAGSVENPRQSFDFWRVVAVSSLAVSIINLGILYFLTIAVRTAILSDATVYNRHPSFFLTEPEASPAAAR